MRIESLFTARRMCKEAIAMIEARPDNAWRAFQNTVCVYDKTVNGGCAIGGLRPNYRAGYNPCVSIAFFFYQANNKGAPSIDFLDALSIPQVCWHDSHFRQFCCDLQDCHDCTHDKEQCLHKMRNSLTELEASNDSA